MSTAREHVDLTLFFSAYEDEFVEVTLCVPYPDGHVARFSQLAASKAEGRISVAKKFLHKLETEERQKNLEHERQAGRMNEVLQILERALLDAESMRKRHGPFGVSRATAF